MGIAVRQWLAGKGLEHLAESFIMKEYCDVEVMKEMGLDEDDLDFLEVTDAEERAILLGKASAKPAPKAPKAEAAPQSWSPDKQKDIDEAAAKEHFASQMLADDKDKESAAGKPGIAR